LCWSSGPASTGKATGTAQLDVQLDVLCAAMLMLLVAIGPPFHRGSRRAGAPIGGVTAHPTVVRCSSQSVDIKQVVE
jgi:hypothetical protein